MKARFFELAEALTRELAGRETLLCHLCAERSDFVRFNRARVRQAGTVTQAYLTLRLVSAGRQASARLALADEASDLALCRASLGNLRVLVNELPQDPWLLYSTEPHTGTTGRRGCIPPAEALVDHVARRRGAGDFVGFYAAGTIERGFASSLGQRNWHEVETFNVDWSLHLGRDRAVKDAYAGFEWDNRELERRLEASESRLALMAGEPCALEPASYRTYLAPAAIEEIVGLLQWDAFSARARHARRSALLRMEHGERLAEAVSVAENTEEGVAPAFQEDGFLRPPRVALVTRGALGEPLVSPRSAREYGIAANGANTRESPESIDMAGGELEEADVLAALDTGLYVSNLWYLNFSDKAAARMTGMTRFATFWVERGRIRRTVAPLRFDDTLYRMFGSELLQLTRARELLLSTSTYDERSTTSARLPGTLLESLRFTL